MDIQGVEIPRTTTDLNESDPIRAYRVPFAEAVRLVKNSKRRHLFVRAAHTSHRNNAELEVSAYVQAPKPAVLRFLDHAHPAYRREGVELQVSICNNCLFVG